MAKKRTISKSAGSLSKSNILQETLLQYGSDKMNPDEHCVVPFSLLSFFHGWWGRYHDHILFPFTEVDEHHHKELMLVVCNMPLIIG